MAFQSNADRRKVTDLQQELQVVSQSFNVFDRERKGFISAKDMQRALKDAGDTSNVSEEELQGMIRATCNRDNFEYEDYKVMMAELSLIDYREGDVVFEEGDMANNFYLVASGHLQVLIRKAGSSDKSEQQELGRLQPGEYFGEVRRLAALLLALPLA
jgi:hypothetical protein